MIKGIVRSAIICLTILFLACGGLFVGQRLVTTHAAGTVCTVNTNPTFSYTPTLYETDQSIL